MTEYRLAGMTADIPEDPQARENLKTNLKSSMMFVGALYKLFDTQYDKISKKSMLHMTGGMLAELGKQVREIEKLQEETNQRENLQ